MWNRQKDSKCYHEVNVLWNLYRCILTIFMIFRYLWGHNSFREEERLNDCLNNCLGAVFNSNVIMYCKFVADRQVHWCCICIYYQIITDFFRFSGFIYNYCVHVYNVKCECCCTWTMFYMLTMDKMKNEYIYVMTMTGRHFQRGEMCNRFNFN